MGSLKLKHNLSTKELSIFKIQNQQKYVCKGRRDKNKTQANSGFIIG